MIDLLIIGAGPAGLSAAIAAAEQGLKIKVIDEFIKPGGRLLGQLHEEGDGVWWNGIDEARILQRKAEDLGVVISCGVSVYNLEKHENEWCVYTTEEIIEVQNIIIATGAAETAVPISGWTLPGVMSIGAAQVMTNVHRVKVGERGVVVGVNVLSVAITRELQLAGIQVSQMLLPEKNQLNETAGSPKHVFQSLLRVAHLAPSKFISLGSKMLKSELLRNLVVRFYPNNLIKMWGVPVQLRSAAVEIIGDKQVEAVKVVKVTADGEPVRGSEKVIPADFVCIAGGLYPLAELAAVAGCPFEFVPELGGHIPLHNVSMETPLAGLYVAGNITGIESAKVAMAQGVVAGLSVAKKLNNHANISRMLDDAVEKVAVTRREALIQFDPNIEKGRQEVDAAWKKQAAVSG